MWNPEPTKGRIAALDGWRCCSILLVMYGHLTTWSSIKDMPFAGYEYVGVAFFFAISGFVICLGLLREFESSGRISITSFYIRRCFRILPSLILFLIAAWSFAITPPQFIAKAALFLCNLSACTVKIGHTWSLAYEEQFYVLFPVTLAVLLTFSKRWILLSVALAWPIFVTALYYFEQGKLALFLSWFELLLFGAAFALYRDQAARIVRRIGPIGLYIAVPMIFVAFVSGSRAASLITLFVHYPLIAYAVFASTCIRTGLHPILESIPMRYLGRISYGVYLFQQPFLCSDDGQGPSFYIAAIIAIFVMAAFSYAFMEAPLIRFGARLSDHIKTSARFASVPA
jgi:peptidoglycan/LPS O-acetylase OafA/YrhL